MDQIVRPESTTSIGRSPVIEERAATAFDLGETSRADDNSSSGFDASPTTSPNQTTSPDNQKVDTDLFNFKLTSGASIELLERAATRTAESVKTGRERRLQIALRKGPRHAGVEILLGNLVKAVIGKYVVLDLGVQPLSLGVSEPTRIYHIAPRTHLGAKFNWRNDPQIQAALRTVQGIEYRKANRSSRVSFSVFEVDDPFVGFRLEVHVKKAYVA